MSKRRYVISSVTLSCVIVLAILSFTVLQNQNHSVGKIAIQVPRASLIEPSGPIVEPPKLLNDARLLCEKSSNIQVDLCTSLTVKYVYGLPLIVMNNTRSKLGCLIGVNKLFSTSKLANSNSRTVVAPNDDTLYSLAFLDLRKSAIELSIPKVSSRYINFQLMDMYTNTFADIGTLTQNQGGKKYIIVGPGYKGLTPIGWSLIKAPTPDVWMLGRSAVYGGMDVQNVIQLQKSYKMSPLALPGYQLSGGPSSMMCGPGSETDLSSTEVFPEISKLMALDPPPSYDSKTVTLIDSISHIPSKSISNSMYQRAISLGSQLIHSPSSQPMVWAKMPVAGTFGTDYEQRAFIALHGLGAQVSSQAVYFSLSVNNPGASVFTLRFSKSQLPPLGPVGFWSVTLYSPNLFFYPNAKNRYSITSHTGSLNFD
ncbi:MAG: DUF1254 domain-containing protein, partial [Acidimicrobiales bacterium]|nr:DUF1254 domain-containing protein [Acidimicrobiales bacterium]